MSVVTFEEVSAGLDDMTVIDVRNRDEVTLHGQIPGSHCLPLGEISSALELEDAEFSAKYGFPKPSADTNLVTHCLKGGRAAKAAETFNSKGCNAKVYAGSFNDWKAQGGTIQAGQPFVPDN